MAERMPFFQRKHQEAEKTHSGLKKKVYTRWKKRSTII